MKKLLSITLVIAIVAAVFSVNVFAAETTKTEALLEKMNTSKEVSVTLRTGKGEELGSDYGVTSTVYAKDDKFAFDLYNGFVNMRAVATDGKIVGYLPIFPFFYLEIDSDITSGEDIWDAVKGLSDITMGFLYHVDDYNETVDGTEYYVEEFNDREYVTSKFYYIDDELKMLRAEDVQKKTVQYTYFDEISFEVEDGVFDVPAFAINLTFIFEILFSSLIGTLTIA